MSSLSIVGISGSLRSGSFNTSLLRYVSTILPENVQYTELSIADIPLYNADIQAEGYPEAVAAFRDGIAAADGILIVSPEYNYTIPGSLKNAIDW
ncbi:MAG: NADPH-dependent FMN reductase, partial [Candidatus Kapaibacterium sp.]